MKVGGGSPAAERLAALVGRGALRLPLPGAGATWERWLTLAELGRQDLPLARLAEGHTDAMAILSEAGLPDAHPGAVMGVWAAGPLSSLEARPTSRGWRLHGVRRWCSGAGSLTHALVTASVKGAVGLFLVALEQPAVSIVPGTWPAVGMAASDTFDVGFDGARAECQVEGLGFYLERPGFWFGSMGVAAVWWGGAVGVAEVLRTDPTTAGGDPHRLAHLGAVHARQWSMEATLAKAARQVDDYRQGSVDLPVLARTVRHVVESGATEILDRVGRATGAGPLGHDGPHAHRVADLTVYLRQSHAESDLADLGARLTADDEVGPGPPAGRVE